MDIEIDNRTNKTTAEQNNIYFHVNQTIHTHDILKEQQKSSS